MYRSYYRDHSENALLIGNMENYGETSMLSYFAYRQNYYESIRQSVKDGSMGNGTVLGYYSDSFQYRCENLLEEHYINGLIWGKEYELIRIFALWSSDALLYDRITDKEKALCEEVIEKHSETADNMETYFGKKEDILFLQVIEAGVRIDVWSEADEQMKYYVMDKKYFWGTEVWGMWMNECS